MITEVPIFGTTSGARARSGRLPERINGSRRAALIAADAAVVFFVSLVALNGAPSRVAAALVVTAMVCGVFWQCGFYRRSFAVYAHDEVYYACAGVLLAALPVAVVLSAVGTVPGISIALAIVFSAVGTAAAHTRLHLERRSGAPLAIGIDSITPGAWHDRESTGFTLSKRIFDVTLALVGLIIASPIMLAAAIAIFLESGAPIIFRQERVGAGGRPFSVYKFRTMARDAGSQWARPGDDRITRAGAFLRRTSIDELPQLINVLRGDMSIVGPRPEMIEFAKTFAAANPNYDQRHVVAPGITGWAQLYYKRSLTPDDVPNVLRLDLFYVEHASLTLDIALVLKTAVEVLSHRAV
jgi:lipopolysaccharide/colanic/teichoic acid biosynthesis glycosyltransferase